MARLKGEAPPKDVIRLTLQNLLRDCMRIYEMPSAWSIEL